MKVETHDGPDRSILPSAAAPPRWRVLPADFYPSMPIWDYHWLLAAMTPEDSWGSALWTNEYIARLWAGGRLDRCEPVHPDAFSENDPYVFRTDGLLGDSVPGWCYGPLQKDVRFEPDRSGGNGSGIASWTPELRQRRWDDEFIYSPAAARMMTNAEYYRKDGPPVPRFARFESWESRDREMRRWQAELPDPKDPAIRESVVRPEFAQRILVDHPVFIAFCRTGHLPEGVQTIDDVLSLPGEPVRRPPIPAYWEEREYKKILSTPRGAATTDDYWETDEHLWTEFLLRFPENYDGPVEEGRVSPLTQYRAQTPPRHRVVPTDFERTRKPDQIKQLMDEITIEDSWGSQLLRKRDLAIRYAIGLLGKRSYPFDGR